MNDLNPRAVAGGNNPPSPLELLREELDATCVELVKARDFWLAREKDIPNVSDALSAATVTQYASDVGKCIREIEDARVVAKAPYLEAGRLIDSQFQAIKEPLELLKNGLTRALTLYQREADVSRSRGDLGATASLRPVWVASNVDYAELDLAVLRPFISMDALDKALRAAIRHGLRQIKGATIAQESRTTIR